MIGRIQNNRAADRDTATFLNFEERNSVKLTAARTQSILEAAVKRWSSPIFISGRLTAE